MSLRLTLEEVKNIKPGEERSEKALISGFISRLLEEVKKNDDEELDDAALLECIIASLQLSSSGDLGFHLGNPPHFVLLKQHTSLTSTLTLYFDDNCLDDLLKNRPELQEAFYSLSEDYTQEQDRRDPEQNTVATDDHSPSPPPTPPGYAGAASCPDDDTRINRVELTLGMILTVSTLLRELRLIDFPPMCADLLRDITGRLQAEAEHEATQKHLGNKEGADFETRFSCYRRDWQRMEEAKECSIKELAVFKNLQEKLSDAKAASHESLSDRYSFFLISDLKVSAPQQGALYLGKNPEGHIIYKISRSHGLFYEGKIEKGELKGVAPETFDQLSNENLELFKSIKPEIVNFVSEKRHMASRFTLEYYEGWLFRESSIKAKLALHSNALNDKKFNEDRYRWSQYPFTETQKEAIAQIEPCLDSLKSSVIVEECKREKERTDWTVLVDPKFLALENALSEAQIKGFEKDFEKYKRASKDLVSTREVFRKLIHDSFTPGFHENLALQKELRPREINFSWVESIHQYKRDLEETFKSSRINWLRKRHQFSGSIESLLARIEETVKVKRESASSAFHHYEKALKIALKSKEEFLSVASKLLKSEDVRFLTAEKVNAICKDINGLCDSVSAAANSVDIISQLNKLLLQILKGCVFSGCNEIVNDKLHRYPDAGQLIERLNLRPDVDAIGSDSLLKAFGSYPPVISIGDDRGPGALDSYVTVEDVTAEIKKQNNLRWKIIECNVELAITCVSLLLGKERPNLEASALNSVSKMINQFLDDFKIELQYGKNMDILFPPDKQGLGSLLTLFSLAKTSFLTVNCSDFPEIYKLTNRLAGYFYKLKVDKIQLQSPPPLYTGVSLTQGVTMIVTEALRLAKFSSYQVPPETMIDLESFSREDNWLQICNLVRAALKKLESPTTAELVPDIVIEVAKMINNYKTSRGFMSVVYEYMHALLPDGLLLTLLEKTALSLMGQEIFSKNNERFKDVHELIKNLDGYIKQHGSPLLQDLLRSEPTIKRPTSAPTDFFATPGAEARKPEDGDTPLARDTPKKSLLIQFKHSQHWRMIRGLF